MFISAFRTAFHWSLSSARSIQSILAHPFLLKSILILSSHLRFCLPNGLFPSGFPIKILYALLPINATCPAYLIFLDFIILITFGEECVSFESCHCAVFSNRLSFYLSSVKLLFSVPCSQILSNVLPLIVLKFCYGLG
jgi:hypothetical protein